MRVEDALDGAFDHFGWRIDERRPDGQHHASRRQDEQRPLAVAPHPAQRGAYHRRSPLDVRQPPLD